MRKLAIFIFILLAITVVWSIVAHLSPGIKSASIGFWSTVLGGAWALITGAWYNLLTLASTNGTTFLIYTLSVLIVAVFFWAAMRKLWERRPKIFGKVGTSVKSTSSSLAGATGLRSTTPAGATTRPTTTTIATPKPVATLEPTVEAETVEEEIPEA